MKKIRLTNKKYIEILKRDCELLRTKYFFALDMLAMYNMDALDLLSSIVEGKTVEQIRANKDYQILSAKKVAFKPRRTQ